MLATIKGAISGSHKEGTVHSEFWKFVAYCSATAILLRQGWAFQISWPFVVLFCAYLAIIGGSSLALKIIALISRREDQRDGH